MTFRDDFMWGAASASYQIEGAYNEDGKGLSIWDVYSKVPGKVRHSENGDMACDSYHRYKEDIALMKEMGLKYYRFSISWPRVIPNGTGEVNSKGLQFYIDFVDELIKAGIEPMVTLFHWDYPYELYRKGGWLNDESSDWFEAYAEVVVKALSDKVKYWMTINEPQCIVGVGCEVGRHAPYMTLPNKDLILMSHNILKAHGKAVKVIRKFGRSDAKVTFVPIAPVYIPENDTKEAIESARERSMSMKGSKFFSITWWSDPVYLGKYPDEAYEIFGEDMINPSEEDMELISQKLDFYATNLYYSQGDRNPLTYSSNSFKGAPLNSLSWVIDERVMYWSPKFLYERYGLPVLIGENGLAARDRLSLDGKVHDPARIDFISRYIGELMRASHDGVPVIGYLYWSVMDNFEWSEGYDERFGLIHVEYSSLKRTIKDSGHWYKGLIESNGDIL